MKYFALLIVFSCTIFGTESQSHTQQSDQEVLLDLLAHWTVPPNHNWKSSTVANACTSWNGVFCDSDGYVQYLMINGFGISGPLPDSLGNFTRLSILWLSNNSWKSEIPTTLGRSNCSLTQLKIEHNLNGPLLGCIPDSLNQCTSLSVIDLKDAGMSCEYPQWINSLTSLKTLVLGNNSFTGSLPDTFSSNQHLITLDVSYNKLTGAIPPSIVNLTSLTRLELEGNEIECPSDNAFINFCSDLITCDISSNCPPLLDPEEQPVIVFFLTNWTSDCLPADWKLNSPQYACQWTGVTCTKYSITQLTVTGGNNVPACRNIADKLIPDTISLLNNIQILELSSMGLTGPLPDSVRLLRNLRKLNLQQNALTGSITPFLANLQQLQQLLLNNNQFDGFIPDLRSLSNLVKLDLSSNHFTKTLANVLTPSKSANLVWNLANNQFQGTVPQSWHTGSWETLDLSNNQFEGSLPVLNATNLLLNNNQFTGSLPSSIFQVALETIDVSHNNLTGDLPEITTSSKLSVINLANNYFNGTIPETFVNLTSLTTLRLDNNVNMVGLIPNDMIKLPHLEMFTFENTGLECPDTSEWVTWAKELGISSCGFPDPQPNPDDHGKHNKKKIGEIIGIVVGVVCGLALIGGVATCVFYQRSKKSGYKSIPG